MKTTLPFFISNNLEKPLRGSSNAGLAAISLNCAWPNRHKKSKQQEQNILFIKTDNFQGSEDLLRV
jgi:hypothetical protein